MVFIVFWWILLCVCGFDLLSRFILTQDDFHHGSFVLLAFRTSTRGSWPILLLHLPTGDAPQRTAGSDLPSILGQQKHANNPNHNYHLHLIMPWQEKKRRLRWWRTRCQETKIRTVSPLRYWYDSAGGRWNASVVDRMWVLSSVM